MERYKEKKRYDKWRRKYLKRLYQFSQKGKSIVYIDETGFAPGTSRSHGYSLKGKRIYGEVDSARRPRTSLIGGYRNRKLTAPVLFSGTCNALIFNAWLKDHLLPELQPGDVIVMDNAAFHKSKETQNLIKEAGCHLLFLPPYSPHLNPIEKLWANIKRAWKYEPLNNLDNILKKSNYLWN